MIIHISIRTMEYYLHSDESDIDTRAILERSREVHFYHYPTKQFFSARNIEYSIDPEYGSLTVKEKELIEKIYIENDIDLFDKLEIYPLTQNENVLSKFFHPISNFSCICRFSTIEFIKYFCNKHIPSYIREYDWLPGCWYNIDGPFLVVCERIDDNVEIVDYIFTFLRFFQSMFNHDHPKDIMGSILMTAAVCNNVKIFQYLYPKCLQISNYFSQDAFLCNVWSHFNIEIIDYLIKEKRCNERFIVDFLSKCMYQSTPLEKQQQLIDLISEYVSNGTLQLRPSRDHYFELID
jgi:hypothetical protein